VALLAETVTLLPMPILEAPLTFAFTPMPTDPIPLVVTVSPIATELTPKAIVLLPQAIAPGDADVPATAIVTFIPISE
jgi:hypothetical protein